MAELITPPRTRYAKSGDVSIAHQVIGDGPIDVVIVPGYISHVELLWEIPLVSGTVKDLVAGSGITFADRGEHALKGIPDQWRIFAVDGQA